MEAPKCKVCGGRHWNSAAHIGMTKAKGAVKAPKVKRKTKVRNTAHA